MGLKGQFDTTGHLCDLLPLSPMFDVTCDLCHLWLMSPLPHLSFVTFVAILESEIWREGAIKVRDGKGVM